MQADPARLFVDSTCLPFLRDSQNKDGGWGFRPSLESRVEPTCWAVHAMLASSDEEVPEALDGAFQFLGAAQLPDGSWPASPEQRNGCWVTSLACWALLSGKQATHAVEAGLKWLCEDWPRDSAFWQRLLRRLASRRNATRTNDSYRGWPWTPGTSSWVEPTAFALLTLGVSPRELVPAIADGRRKLAEAFLLDRMCPGGGWNCGNPMVYGVPGEPFIIPTVWALLALRDSQSRGEIARSLQWLEEGVAKIRGPGSLALAKICLEAYGRNWPTTGPELQSLYDNNEFLQNTQTAAWMCLALGARRGWLMTRSPVLA